MRRTSGAGLTWINRGHRADCRGESALRQSDLLFRGTNAVSGSATTLVVSTGSRTYFAARWPRG